MKLSKRLQAIANFVPKNTVVADIGTDHGHIPKYLIDNNISKMVIATDISYNSLKKTIDYVKDYNYLEIIPRVGDGLEVVKPFEIDTVIISGMGGLLIKEILDKDINKTSSILNFVLQPNVASKELREYLIENNFKILDEDLVKEDGKYYEIIYAQKGKDFIDKTVHLEISKKLMDKNHPLLKEYLEFKIRNAENIIEQLKDKTTEKSIRRINELQQNIESYQEVLKGL